MGIDRYAKELAASTTVKARQVVKEQAKKARQRERRKAKQDLSAAVGADIWQDRDGKARPTTERRARGAWVLRDGEDAGVTVAVDEHAHILDRLAHKGIITSEQCQGGHDLSALLERTRLVSGGRSCLDMTPVGFDSGTGNDWQEQRDERDRAELYIACGTLTWRELRSVCHEGHQPHNLIRLRHGLDLCAKFWGGIKK